MEAPAAVALVARRTVDLAPDPTLKMEAPAAVVLTARRTVDLARDPTLKMGAPAAVALTALLPTDLAQYLARTVDQGVVAALVLGLVKA